MIASEARAILTAVLAPLSVDRFFDEFMGKSVVALTPDGGDARASLLGSDPARTVLDAFATHSDKLASHAHAPSGPAPRPVRADSADAFRSSIDRFHDRGYTVRVPAITSLSPALAQFVRALESMIRQPAKVSLFWSGADARAPVHYDDNDNIVIQLIGRKQWLVSTAPASLHNAWRDVAETPTPLGDHQTIDLAPGSLLYVPRGTPHTVVSQTESLHLAITFTPVTLRDVMIAALDHLSDHDRTLRDTALGRSDAVPDLHHLSASVIAALDKLRQHAASADFIAAALERRTSRMIGAMERLDGASAVGLSVATAVIHSPLAMAHMMATPTTVDFCQPGEHINIHRGVEPALRFIAATPAFRVSNLPGDLTDDVKVALVGRLVTSGFLHLDRSPA